jgi:hypothetical protein
MTNGLHVRVSGKDMLKIKLCERLEHSPLGGLSCTVVKALKHSQSTGQPCISIGIQLGTARVGDTTMTCVGKSLP